MDRELICRLYGQYGRALYLYLHAMAGDRAQDLLQETFLKAMLSLPPGHPNVRAWLYTVARNLCISDLRREGRTASLEDYGERDGGDGVVEEVLTDEKHRLLYQALGTLEPRRREVLELMYFSGLAQKEIAAVLRTSPENVRTLAYRAKRELRRYMEENGYELS